MLSISTIYYVSIIVWIFPIIRQYNTRLFYFFLILGLSDPLNLFLVSILKIKPGIIHCVAAILLFYSLGLTERLKLKISFTDILAAVLFMFAVFFADLLYLTLALHLLILARVFQMLIIPLHNKSVLNIFYLVLIFYEITLVVNLFTLIRGGVSGLSLYYITIIFQLLIAIFFSIFKENDPPIMIKISSKQD